VFSQFLLHEYSVFRQSGYKVAAEHYPQAKHGGCNQAGSQRIHCISTNLRKKTLLLTEKVMTEYYRHPTLQLHSPPKKSIFSTLCVTAIEEAKVSHQRPDYWDAIVCSNFGRNNSQFEDQNGNPSKFNSAGHWFVRNIVRPS
jgi:hypothetical protein